MADDVRDESAEGTERPVGRADREHTFPPEPVARRRAPAGQALAVMLASLLVACLLNADRLDHTAHIQPFGWQRTVVLHLTGPLKSISDATLLNRPRKWLSHSAGNTDPPPPIDTKTVVTAPPIDGSASGPTTTTRPLVVRTPTAADPVRILVAGDSLMGWIKPALVQQFGDRPVAVTEDFKIGTGLARPDVTNWPVQIKDDAASTDPEVVVVGFGGNDAQDMSTDDGRVHLGTKAWAAEYQKRVAQILNAVEKPGRTVYWIGLPITTRSNIQEAAPAMRKAEKTEIAARPWAHFIDTYKTLSPDGTYTQYLPDAGGTEVKVREGDGVHPNLAGANRVVGPLVEALIKERKLF